MKDFSGHVLRFFAIFHAPRHKRINAIEVALIKIGKPAGIALGRFNQTPFVIQTG